ncbi:hypothetical protein IC582_005142 [Cucumis melo]
MLFNLIIARHLTRIASFLAIKILILILQNRLKSRTRGLKMEFLGLLMALVLLSKMNSSSTVLLGFAVRLKHGERRA